MHLARRLCPKLYLAVSVADGLQSNSHSPLKCLLKYLLVSVDLLRQGFTSTP